MKVFKTILLVVLISSMSVNMLCAQREQAIVLYKNKPLVEVTINGTKAWALLDANIDFTVFNAEDQDVYGFKNYKYSNDQYRLNMREAQNLNFQVVGDADISIGDESLYGAKLSADISPLVREVSASSGRRISLIIGLNMMKHHGFSIDVCNSTVFIPRQLFKDSLDSDQSYSMIK
ncbi:MAG: hypothetical protein ACJAT1_000212 [Marivirga sp.]|jgi:hypothetical protein